MGAFACLFVRACLCVRRSARVCGFAHLCANTLVCVHSACVCAWHGCARVPRGCVGRAVARRVTGGINSSARGAMGAARSCLFVLGAHRRGRRAWAAGVTWASRTLKAEWAGRFAHTSVIDAAGAIYVIGGQGKDRLSGTEYQDVWASSDKGARPEYTSPRLVRGTTGALWGYSGASPGYHRGHHKGAPQGVLRGTTRGTTG